MADAIPDPRVVAELDALFEQAVVESWRRYETDAVFHRTVRAVARALEPALIEQFPERHERASAAAKLALRAVVAGEFIRGGY
jgi:hypothetical protein